ncbi:MAG: glycosyltransferase [Elusimicrobia bacterium]|nr:glycosyltransferase [Elusimicrobiota bacterium]
MNKTISMDNRKSQTKIAPDLKSLYESIDKDFYLDQRESKNPLRKWFHLNRYRIANSLVKSKYKEGSKVVDVGCGSCDWNMDHLEVFGIDLNQNLLEAAKQKRRLTGYKIAEAHDTGLPSDSFDIVTAFEFLEHLPNYESVIQEGKRLLKPGGYFILSVPYDVLLSLWRPLFFLQVLFQGYVLQNEYYKKRCGHVNHFSFGKIKDAFLKHGYSIDLIFDMRKFTIFMRAQKKMAVQDNFPSSYEDVSIVLPTLNEEKGLSYLLPILIERYKSCAIIISDDGSKDHTKKIALGFQYKSLTFIDRSSEPAHGLTVSILDALRAVKTKYFVVLDADGQHPPEKIEEVVNILRLGTRLVIASRVEVDQGWGTFRKILSYGGTLLGKISLLVRGKNYLSYDILGGFYGCHSKFWRRCSSKPLRDKCFRLNGYKVLFDFLKHAPLRLFIEEVYYRFETRRAGVTKINLKIYMEYLKSCFSA